MTFTEVIDFLVREDNKDSSDKMIFEENDFSEDTLISNVEEENNVTN